MIKVTLCPKLVSVFRMNFNLVGMKQTAVLLLMIIIGTAAAQKVQTITPTRPVIEGTAFQIQYVISNPSEIMSVYPPDFDSLQLISGPNHYKGVTIIEGKQQPIDNIAYTVLAKKPGRYSVQGPDITYKNFTHQRGQDVVITVVPAPKASYNSLSSYTDVNLYAPSKKVDYEKLIDQNLFVKTEVNKKTCFTGEPVVVTFTLFSRLQSSTEATKSPAFYGFSVVDMVDINRSHPGVQTIDGKVYNTSILRKVQLYPVEKGIYTIDRMYLHNEIEFDDSLQKTNKKIIINRDLTTEPVSIFVKPLPGKAPADFSGAVGEFSLKARLKSDTIRQHQEATLLITISGKGNFLQFAQPMFDSIPGIDIIDVRTIDKINNEVAPQEGSRTYMINFTADTTGRLLLPPIYFSYFDINHESYKSIQTDSLICHVLPLMKTKPQENGPKKLSKRIVWIVVLAIIIVLVFGIQFFRLQKKPITPVEKVQTDHSEALEPERLKEYSGKAAVLYIQKTLRQALKDEANVYSEKQRVKIMTLIEKCELIIYTNVELTTPEKLRKEAYEALKLKD